MRDMLGDRAVWNAALTDLLRVLPLTHIVAELPGMPTRALQATCIRLVRLDRAWNTPQLIPHRVDAHDIGQSVFGLAFLPGGHHLVALDSATGRKILLYSIAAAQPVYVMDVGRVGDGIDTWVGLCGELQVVPASSRTAYVVQSHGRRCVVCIPPSASSPYGSFF